MSEVLNAETGNYDLAFSLTPVQYAALGGENVCAHFIDIATHQALDECRKNFQRLSRKAVAENLQLPAGTPSELCAWGKANGYIK